MKNLKPTVRLSAILAASTMMSPAIYAQSTLERLNQLEISISQKEAELKSLKSEVSSMQAVLKPQTATPILVSVVSDPICKMADASDLNSALRGREAPTKNSKELLPNLNNCKYDIAGSQAIPAGDVPTEKGSAMFAAQRLSQAVPNRVNVGSGFSSNIEFGNSGKAALSYSHPIIWRKVSTDKNDIYTGFKPQLGTLSLGISTPIDKGVGNLLNLKERKSRRDLDVLSGTVLKVGFDFLRFEKRNAIESEETVLDVLFDAFKGCYAEAFPNAQAPKEDQFKALYSKDREVAVQAGTVLPTQCKGEKLVQFILATKDDPSMPGGKGLKRADLATRYQQSFWSAPKTEVPNWGWGASVELGTNDFEFQQASNISKIGSGTTDDPFKLDFDRSVALPAAQQSSKTDFKVTGYVMKYWSLDNKEERKKSTPRNNIPGIMFLASFDYLSEAGFRDGTADVFYCPPMTGQAQPGTLPLFPNCSTVNIDRPYRTKSHLLSLEARAQMENVPYIGAIGVAPKFTYRLDDDRLKYDFPLYLKLDKDKKLSTGIRLVHQAGGIDSIGNPLVRDTSVSLFFSTLNFRGI